MLKEILTARTRPSDKALYNIWARKLSSGWTETTITGSLPLTFRAKGDTLTQTDPPQAFPAITAYQGENTLSSTETVGSVSVTGKIKEVTP